MTDNEINIAIAEALGWRQLRTNDYRETYGEPPEGEIGRVLIPNFCGDLNACAEMEGSMEPDSVERGEYNECLRDMAETMTDLISAPALMRCKAFLFARGLFREETK